MSGKRNALFAMLQIVEIGEIARQGITQPVFCRAEDGHEYVVKGQYAGRKALVAEYLANSLGRLLELPIPPFELLEVEPQVFQFGANREAIELLGRGTLFGSRRIPHVNEIQHIHLPRVDLRLQAKVLAFDWWIANSDRIYGEYGGNPNLLWDVPDEKCWVIDHNLAFEPDKMGDFFSLHVFHAARSLWTPHFCREMEEVFARSLKNLQTLWDQLPTAWTEAEVGLNLKEIRAILSKFQADSPNFWTSP